MSGSAKEHLSLLVRTQNLPVAGSMRKMGMFRQLRNSSNVLTPRMDRYPPVRIDRCQFLCPLYASWAI